MGQHDNARVYGGPNAAGDSWEAIDRVHALQLDAGRQEERTMQAALRPISFDMSENGRQVIRVCVCERERERESRDRWSVLLFPRKTLHLSLLVCVRVCVCVVVCVCVCV